MTQQAYTSHPFRVLVHDWTTVVAQSPITAATKRSRQLNLKPGDSILVMDKNSFPLQYIVGRAPQILIPLGRMSNVPS